MGKSLKINLGGSGTSDPNKSPGEGMTIWSRNATVFRTPSSTRQGREHLTVFSNDDLEEIQPVCTCEGFQYRGKCKHIDAAQKFLDNETPPNKYVEPIDYSDSSWDVIE